MAQICQIQKNTICGLWKAGFQDGAMVNQPQRAVPDQPSLGSFDAAGAGAPGGCREAVRRNLSSVGEKDVQGAWEFGFIFR